jgi:hypothetical protein
MSSIHYIYGVKANAKVDFIQTLEISLDKIGDHFKLKNKYSYVVEAKHWDKYWSPGKDLVYLDNYMIYVVYNSELKPLKEISNKELVKPFFIESFDKKKEIKVIKYLTKDMNRNVIENQIETLKNIEETISLLIKSLKKK